MIHGQKGLKLPTGSSVVSSHGESIILPVNHQFGMPFIGGYRKRGDITPGCLYLFFFLIRVLTGFVGPLRLHSEKKRVKTFYEQRMRSLVRAFAVPADNLIILGCAVLTSERARRLECTCAVHITSYDRFSLATPHK